jgi:hypothetical protein
VSQLAAGTLPPLRLFLDAGVVIDGCSNTWGASKAVLILATRQLHVTVVLADVVDREIRRALLRKATQATAAGVQDVLTAYQGWLDRIQAERIAAPSLESIELYVPTVLPVLRHINDLRAAINAIETKPDWVLSTNTAHWGPALAARTGLRIASPWEFLEYLLRLRA